jgi:uncharacterized Tic20 family protein
MSEEAKNDSTGTEEVVSPVASELTADDKLWGMLSHLLTFSGYVIPFGNILAPLIIMLVQKDKSEYVVYHAKESLNMQIAYSVYGFVVAILCFVLIGFILLPVIAIAWIVFVIIAGMKANEGIKYQYPYIFRLIK